MPTTSQEASPVVKSLSEISGQCRDIIAHAKECAKDDVEQFISKDIGKLFKVVWTYKNAFERMQVRNKSDFEKAMSPYFRSEEVREYFDALLENEQVWDEFLQEVDSKLVISNNKPLFVGDPGPSTVSVIDRELLKAGGSVLLVSFGEEHGAKKWLEDTGSFFDMVLDPQRKIYQAFGLNRSVFKVWSVECMCFYAEKLIEGRQFPKPLENVHDDPQQMGGDFILDASGTVIFTHCSQISSDRPSIATLLSIVREKRMIQKPNDVVSRAGTSSAKVSESLTSTSA